jgi:NDP-sugar pyrophosphorylase family protein
MADLVIIAAGNGTRMGDVSIPKILYPILGDCNLDRTYRYLKLGEKPVINKLYVAIKEEDELQFQNHIKEKGFSDDVVLLPIKSGLGDGHAVLESLKLIYKDEVLYTDDLVIMWGDCVLTSADIISEVLDKPSSFPLIFPVIKEVEPYVWFKKEDDKVVSANFSKRGEIIEEGFHDQSIFRINSYCILTKLLELHNTQWRNNSYMFNNELNFLHLIHYLHNCNMRAEMYETKFNTYSFNTVVQAQDIEKKLH